MEAHVRESAGTCVVNTRLVTAHTNTHLVTVVLVIRRAIRGRRDGESLLFAFLYDRRSSNVHSRLGLASFITPQLLQLYPQHVGHVSLSLFSLSLSRCEDF